MDNRINIDSIKAAVLSLAERRGLKRSYGQTILTVALVLLIAGLMTALWQQPQVLTDLDWRPVSLVIAVTVPLTVFFNAIEFMLTGRLVGQSISFGRALEVTVVGTAANMLPLPGSALVRMASLKAGGTGYKGAASAVLLVFVIWLGLAMAYAGSAILYTSPGMVGAVFLAAGLTIMAAAGVVTMRLRAGISTYVLVLAVKLALVVVDAVQLLFCLNALGFAATFAQASALTLSGVAGHAVSIVPAGLGIREAVAAALSPLVGLAMTSSFLAAALGRVLTIITVVPFAIVLAIRARVRAKNKQTAAG
jgi:hypothetical protein